jgi:molecular chaperone HtpG
MSDIYHFQVNLGGMLDVLSNHLYKSPDVFLRELLQNGVDAITLRQKMQPGYTDGKISIAVEPGRQLIFRDNGAGLSEKDIHRFLAVIGQSSKTELVNGKVPEDYIGRFGIGLLSCFMVSESIVVHTRPAEGGKAHVWTGLPDGTYTLEPLEDCQVGTTVILTAKPGMEHYFQTGKVAELVRYYGLVLPVPIYLSGSPERLNNIPADFSGVSHSQLLAFGEWLFEEEFLDAIPIQTPHISGVAYVLPYRTALSIRGNHRIYLKQMLLTEQGDTLLPSWAFFLQCFLNTRGLRPTASREDFYEDGALLASRDEFADAVRHHLVQLAVEDPERLKRIVSVHAEAIKAMAVWDEELFRLFIDYLSFETSEGRMTGAALKRVGEAVWVHNIPKFKQLRPIFMAQGRLLICTGYTSDLELIQNMTVRFGLPFQPLHEEDMFDTLKDITDAERQRGDLLLRTADRVLSHFECQTRLRRFLPADLPVLYAMSDEVQFLRQIQSAQENSGSIFSDALTSMLSSVEERPVATLYLNLNSSIVLHLCEVRDIELLESMVQVLYVQALLAGGHPLKGGELKTMNQALLALLEHTAGF